MKPSVSIVGAGRVGRTLGRMLHERGWRIAAVVTRSSKTARAAVSAIGSGTPYYGATANTLTGTKNAKTAARQKLKLSELRDPMSQLRLRLPTPNIQAAGLISDVVLVATPDDEIARVAATLARLRPSPWRGRVVLHTSGALDREALTPLARCGAFTGSMHPMQTFLSHGVPRLKGIVFAVEGDSPARRMGARIARELGGIPIAIESASKPAYHAAGALAAGHALALIEAATEILIAIGFSRRRAVNALLPLTRQMLDNFERFGPRATWTGPLARGDFATIRKHIDASRDMPPEFLDAYLALSRLAARTLSAKPESLLRQLKKSLTRSQRRIR